MGQSNPLGVEVDQTVGDRESETARANGARVEDRDASVLVDQGDVGVSAHHHLCACIEGELAGRLHQLWTAYRDMGQ